MSMTPARLSARFVCLTLLGAGFADLNAEPPDPAALRGALQIYNQHTDEALPFPSRDELLELAQGGIVKIRDRVRIGDSASELEDRIRIVGYRVYDTPRLLVWLSALDLSVNHSKRLTEYLIEADTEGTARWYQFLRLPWPVKDRHWVVRSTKDVQLSAATDGFIWEQAWRLEAEGRQTAARLLADGKVAGVSTKQGAKALYAPVNRGGWAMFALDDRRVLVAAHVTTVLGGWVPDRLVARFISAQLESVLQSVEAEALTVHARYDGSHPIYTGDGKLITPRMARLAL